MTDSYQPAPDTQTQSVVVCSSLVKDITSSNKFFPKGPNGTLTLLSNRTLTFACDDPQSNFSISLKDIKQIDFTHIVEKLLIKINLLDGKTVTLKFVSGSKIPSPHATGAQIATQEIVASQWKKALVSLLEPSQVLERVEVHSWVIKLAVGVLVFIFLGAAITYVAHFIAWLSHRI